jgi:hypothetical protein
MDCCCSDRPTRPCTPAPREHYEGVRREAQLLGPCSLTPHPTTTTSSSPACASSLGHRPRRRRRRAYLAGEPTSTARITIPDELVPTVSAARYERDCLVASRKDRTGAYAALPTKARREALAAAWNHAYVWAVAVQVHADRILHGCNTMTTVEQMGEATFLTVDVRTLLRAGEMARLLATGDEATKMEHAIGEFKKELPDVVAARDVLEHFDDYEVGIGDEQNRERRSGRSITDYRMSYEKGKDSYVFNVGAAGRCRSGAGCRSSACGRRSPDRASDHPSDSGREAMHARPLLGSRDRRRPACCPRRRRPGARPGSSLARSLARASRPYGSRLDASRWPIRGRLL